MHLYRCLFFLVISTRLPLKVYSFLLDDTTIADDTQTPVNTQVRNGTEEVGRDG